MKRRDFLILSCLAAAGCARVENPSAREEGAPKGEALAGGYEIDEDGAAGVKDSLETERIAPERAPIIAEAEELELLKSLRNRLDRVMRHIGFANFNIVGFDAAISVAKNSAAVGAFSQSEIEYFEKLFFRDAREYGFYGEKVSGEMTSRIAPEKVFKSPRTGHYLYKGKAAEVYERVKKDVGDSIFLTSGARGVPKQMYLFLTKAIACGGNLSEASRSLAPAGYSYHGIGDFDVGKVGFGEKNFTSEFASTKEYEKLTRLGYIAIRYPRGNPFGVYFEPWHIEVV